MLSGSQEHYAVGAELPEPRAEPLVLSGKHHIASQGEQG